MKAKSAIYLAVKIVVDIAMLIVFLLLMGYHFFENVQHEWLGAAVFVLFLVHNGLNWKWYKNLFKGRYGAVRIVQTVVNMLLWAFMICNIASALMLSRDVFYSWGLMNAAVGRRMHMVTTVWTYLLLSFHLGLHWQMFIGMAKKIVKPSQNVAVVMKWVFRVVALAICVYGLIAFIGRELWNEMFLLVEFKFMDFDEPPVRFFANYLAILGLFACLAHYIKFGLQKWSAHKAKRRRLSKPKHKTH